MNAALAHPGIAESVKHFPKVIFIRIDQIAHRHLSAIVGGQHQPGFIRGKVFQGLPPFAFILNNLSKFGQIFLFDLNMKALADFIIKFLEQFPCFLGEVGIGQPAFNQF